MFFEKTLNHPEDKIRSFFHELLVDGATKHSTILYVRRKLFRHKIKAEILSKDDNIRLMVRAWNDYILGKETQQIKTTEDSFRYVIPV